MVDDLLIERAEAKRGVYLGSFSLRLASGGRVNTLRIRQIVSYPDPSHEIFGFFNCVHLLQFGSVERIILR